MSAQLICSDLDYNLKPISNRCVPFTTKHAALQAAERELVLTRGRRSGCRIEVFYNTPTFRRFRSILIQEA